MTAYAVAEVFSTIQGEATWTGTPSVFIRLMGCGVGCNFCDTKRTWDRVEVDRLDELPRGPRIGLLDNKGRSMPWARMDAAALAARARQEAPAARHAVITGGEPFEQPLGALVKALAGTGFARVQVETSGTSPRGDAPDWPDSAFWVTLSPKVGMPGGKTVLREIVDDASEVKWPVGKPADLGRLHEFLEVYAVPPDLPVWLQPLSRSPKATALCVAAAQESGRLRISVQTHYLLGVA